MKISLFKLLFLIILLFFCLVPAPVRADENFDVTFDFFYLFLDSGNAQVTQTTVLTNKQTNLFATEYEITIAGDLVGPVSGFDKEGKLNLTTSKTPENKTKIQIKFNQRSVGIGSTVTFSLNYELTGLTQNIGRIKEITIPRLGDDPTVSIKNIRVSVPKKFGLVAFVKPLTSYDESETSYIFLFNSDQAKKGLLIGFGDTAHFKFKLTYHLTNKGLIQKEEKIALPPDSPFQQVIYESINPVPFDVTVDSDGNWLAGYTLNPQQSFDVLALGSVLIYPSRREDFKETGSKEEDLKANKYWETDSKEITDLAKQLETPEKIYDYLISNLKYNYGRVNSEKQRLGAQNALNNKDKATCTEFTDAFIAIARKAGVGAREVNGFSYTSDEFLKPLSLVADVLHSWPEYWDGQNNLWVPIDPTWGNTSGLDYFNNLDLNHFVFVRHGASSVMPLPAGSYRKTSEGKDVEITPEKNLPVVPSTKITFSVEVPKKIIAGGEQTILLTVKNLGGIGKYNLPVNVSAPSMRITLGDNSLNLPAYGTKTTIVKLRAEKRNFWGKIPVVIGVGGEEKKFDLEIQPVELLYFPLIIIAFTGLLVFLLLIFRKRHVFKKRT